MGEALLATAGDTIKLWDASNYAFHQEIPFENGKGKHTSLASLVCVVDKFVASSVFA